jgi:hypothetical protein
MHTTRICPPLHREKVQGVNTVIGSSSEMGGIMQTNWGEARQRYRERQQFTIFPSGIGVVVLGFVFILHDSEVLGTFPAFCVCALAVAGAIGITSDLLKAPLRLYCSRCGKYIPSDQTWICGFCAQENQQTSFFHSFLASCERCSRSPKAFCCPHCGGLLYLDQDNEYRWAAHAPGKIPPAPIDPEAEQFARDLQAIRREIEKDKLLTERAKVRQRLHAAEQEGQPVPEPAIPDPIEEELKRLQQAASREEVTSDWWDDKAAVLLDKWQKRGVDAAEIQRRLARVKSAVLQARRS